MDNMQFAIEKYFSGIDGAAEEPIYKQLSERIARYIADHPHNSIFPGEREIATQLNLNRGTIRKALSPFVENRQLRRSQKGTVINKPEGGGFVLDGIHPLTLGMTFPAVLSKHCVPVVLYENLPGQVQFWKETVAEFERRHRDIEIELTWRSMQDKVFNDYQGAAPRSDAGVIQLPVSRLWQDDFGRNFAELSDGLLKIFDNPEYRCRELCGTYPQLLENCVPLNAGFGLLASNNSVLAEQGGGALKPGADIFAFLETAARHLPDEMYLMEHLGGLVQSQGFSMAAEAPVRERVLRQCLPLFQRIYRSDRDILRVPVRLAANTGIYNHFLAGDDLVMFMLAGLVPHIREQAGFEIGLALSQPLDGCHAHINVNPFAVSKDCAAKEAAETFLAYLLSEEVQKRMGELEVCVPVWRGADRYVAAQLHMPEQELTTFFGKCREMPYFTPLWFLLCRELWLALPDLDGNELKTCAVIKEIMEMKLENRL